MSQLSKEAPNKYMLFAGPLSEKSPFLKSTGLLDRRKMNAKRIFKVGCLGLSIILSFSLLATFPVYAANAQNPIMWADVPDPSIIRVGNNYYMSSTTMHMNPGVPIMKSTNLVNWEVVNYVYPTLGNGNRENLNNGQNEYGNGSWASSLRYKNGTYYLSFMSYTSNNTYIYQTTDIESGTWTRYALGTAYHDSSLLFDDDGRVYLIYGAGDIKVVELTSDARAVKAGGLNKTLITNAGSIAGSGGLAAEGAHAFKINGRYYIFLISWPSGGVRTELVYRSDRIDGTYTGRVILQNPGVGIAQGGVVDTPDGKWYAMLFRDTGAVGRIPYLVPVTWSGDGWPVLGSTTDTGINITVGSKFVACDGFDSGTSPGLMWQWNHNPDNNYWSYNSARPGYFRLTNGSVRANIHTAKNTLTQRTFGGESSAIVAMETGGMKDGDYAGLSAFQFYYGYVGVKISGTSKSIVMVRGSTNNSNQTSSPVEVANVPLNQNRVYWKVYTDFRNQTDKAYFYYSLDGNQWTAIGSTLQMAYTLPHFMGYRFGLFTYATKSTGGYVDFDYFKLEPTPVGGCSIGNTPTPTPTNTQPPQTNPIAWYQFDETSGATAADSSGNGRTANLVNGPTWTAGRIGNAIDINGGTQHVSLPAGVVNGLNDFSIATWVRLDTTGNWRRIFDFGNNTTTNMYLTTTNGSVIRFAITTGGSGAEQRIDGSSALPTGAWHHVAVTRSGSTGRLYIDGTQVGQNTGLSLSPASLGSTTNNWIGRSQYSADAYLDGQVDDFRIYNRALSAAEVQGLFNSSGGTPTPTPTSPPSGELLTNGNIETGTSGWSVFGAGALSANTSVVHGGVQSLLIIGRTASWNGISQSMTSKLINGRTYTTNVWVRTQSGTPNAKVTLQLTANGTTSYITLAPAATINSSGWTLLSGTATVSWTGTLSSANFYVETSSGADSFYIDDASFR